MTGDTRQQDLILHMLSGLVPERVGVALRIIAGPDPHIADLLAGAYIDRDLARAEHRRCEANLAATRETLARLEASRDQTHDELIAVDAQRARARQEADECRQGLADANETVAKQGKLIWSLRAENAALTDCTTTPPCGACVACLRRILEDPVTGLAPWKARAEAAELRLRNLRDIMGCALGSTIEDHARMVMKLAPIPHATPTDAQIEASKFADHAPPAVQGPIVFKPPTCPSCLWALAVLPPSYCATPNAHKGARP